MSTGPESMDTVPQIKEEIEAIDPLAELNKTGEIPVTTEQNTDPDVVDSKTRKASLEDEPQLKKTKVNLSNLPPVHEMVGGSSVRQYLNKNLTQHLLEGLRLISQNKPEDPLKELGEFLISRSRQIKDEHN